MRSQAARSRERWFLHGLVVGVALLVAFVVCENVPKIFGIVTEALR